MSDPEVAEFVTAFGMVIVVLATLILILSLMFSAYSGLTAAGALYFLCALCWQFRKKLMRQ